MVSLPQYGLFSEAGAGDHPGRWRFVLNRDDGSPPLEAEDIDPVARGERLELLSVVRGLEALDQPSRVVLTTDSAYVREGIRYGLEEWPRNDWQWESFGKMVPVKNRDLWQRVHRALRFHQIEFRTWRIDAAHDAVPASHQRFEFGQPDANHPDQPATPTGLAPRLRRLVARSWPRIALAGKELDRVACL